MTFIEFVGLVISLAAMIFLILKHFFSIAQQRRNPEEYARMEKQRQDNLRRLLKAKGIDLGLEEEMAPKKKPLPPKAVQKSSPPSPKQPVVDFIKPAESYEVIRTEKKSSGSLLLGSLKSPRDMFVIREILDKPLSMRDQ
jgi:hypothetical protein